MKEAAVSLEGVRVISVVGFVMVMAREMLLLVEVVGAGVGAVAVRFSC